MNRVVEYLALITLNAGGFGQFLIYGPGTSLISGKEVNALGFLKFVRSISKHRWVVAGVMVLSMLAVWLFLRENKLYYEASATVIPSEAALQQPVLEGGVESHSTVNRQTQLANLMRLVESRTVAERVSQTLGGSGNLLPNESIHAGISGGKEAGSEVLEIKVRTLDSRRAIDLANTAAQIFVNYHQELQLREAQNRRVFIENQMQLAASVLKKTEADLSAFEQQYDLSLLAPSRENNRSSSDISYASLNAELSTVRRQIREVSGRLSKTPRLIAHKEAPSDPMLIKDLKDERDSVQTQLDSEIAVNPTSEKVAQLRQQMRELDKRLAESQGKSSSIPNPEYDQQMRELAGLKEERNEILKELGTFEQGIVEQGDLPPGADVKLASLMRSREAALDRYSTIQTQLGQARMEEEQLGSTRSLSILDTADHARGPIGLDFKLWMGIGFLGSLIIGFLLAYLLDALDHRSEIHAQVENVLQLPVTTLIPRYTGNKPEQLPRICYDDPMSPLAEAFRFLRTDLLFSATDGSLKTMMVATARPGEGGSVVAANLAISLAQDGKRVVLVDADLRRPSLHRVFKLENEAGLAEVLKDERDLPDVIVNTEVDNLALIPAGTPPLNPAELLGSWRMRTVINSLKEVADFVVIDTPSALAFADSIVLSQLVDGVLLVLRAQQVAWGAEVQMRNLMNKARARLLGVVLNDVPQDMVNSFYYHSLYYPASKEKRQLPMTERTSTPPELPDSR